MMFGITFGLCACNRDNGNSISPEEENQENNNKTMNIKISGGREFTATMAENSSANALVIYYAPNTRTFTRIGKINDVTQAELKGDVTVTLSLNQQSNVD